MLLLLLLLLREVVMAVPGKELRVRRLLLALRLLRRCEGGVVRVVAGQGAARHRRSSTWRPLLRLRLLLLVGAAWVVGAVEVVRWGARGWGAQKRRADRRRRFPATRAAGAREWHRSSARGAAGEERASASTALRPPVSGWTASRRPAPPAVDKASARTARGDVRRVAAATAAELGGEGARLGRAAWAWAPLLPQLDFAPLRMREGGGHGREPQRPATLHGPTRAPYLHADARRANLAARKGVKGLLRMRSELELQRRSKGKET